LGIRKRIRPIKNSVIRCRHGYLYDAITDNHTSTSSLNFYRPDALPDAQPTASEH